MPITGYPSYVSIATLSNLLIPGYDKAVEFQLREMPTFRSLVDRRPVGVDNPGSTVYFTFYADLATTTTPLSETVTPDPITVANPTRISVSVNEYGAWLPKTLQLEKFAFTQVDWELAELLARQQADTIDALVKTVMDSTTNVFDNTPSRNPAPRIASSVGRRPGSTCVCRVTGSYHSHDNSRSSPSSAGNPIRR